MKKMCLLSALACVVLLSTPAFAQRPDADAIRELQQHPEQLLDVVTDYLSMVQQMRDIVSDPLAILIVIQQDMREIYEKKGDAIGVVKELRRTLDGLKDPGARTAVRLAIADVYKTTGNPDKALTELRAIVAENKALLNKAIPAVKEAK